LASVFEIRFKEILIAYMIWARPPGGKFKSEADAARPQKYYPNLALGRRRSARGEAATARAVHVSDEHL
jgi:hypothetical protein